jgi:hypothetical protein
MCSRRASFVAAVVGLLMLSTVGSAQQPRFKRTGDGHPDLSGIWCRPGCGLELLPPGGDLVTGTIAGNRPAPQTSGPNAPERPQYLPGVVESRPPPPTNPVLVGCMPPTVPGITGSPFPFEIVQTPTKIYFLYEVQHWFRIIPVGKRYEDTDPGYMGDAVASWDGDTLVIDVVNFNDQVSMGHGDTQHVVERYSPSPDGQSIAYTATVSNSKTLVKPYTTRVRLRRHPDRVREYECTENNQDAPHLVPDSPGAR